MKSTLYKIGIDEVGRGSVAVGGGFLCCEVRKGAFGKIEGDDGL